MASEVRVTLVNDPFGICPEVENRVADFPSELVARWVTDFRCLRQALPLVLLTADHGFTYGPPPGEATVLRLGP